jgi:hypothetical protein
LNGKTSAVIAGIEIKGQNKWITAIHRMQRKSYLHEYELLVQMKLVILKYLPMSGPDRKRLVPSMRRQVSEGQLIVCRGGRPVRYYHRECAQMLNLI